MRERKARPGLSVGIAHRKRKRGDEPRFMRFCEMDSRIMIFFLCRNIRHAINLTFKVVELDVAVLAMLVNGTEIRFALMDMWNICRPRFADV